MINWLMKTMEVLNTMLLWQQQYGIMADKKIVAHGSAQALQENDDPRVRQFLDGIADGPVPFRYPAGDYHSDLLGTGS